MKRRITRRDFLNGTQVAIGASLLSPWTEVFGTNTSKFDLGRDYYPPAKTGLRGSHDGAWEAMHARVAGARWPAGPIEKDYDLVVVGGGISGLSAAHFYRRERPSARVLVLDNHDDFGGHAKRNEFEVDGRTRIAYGGTESIDTPSGYSDVSRALLEDIGIDLQKFYEYFDQPLYDDMGLSYAIAFDQETYGRQKLVTGYGQKPWQTFAAETPMSEKARADLVRAFTDERDYLPGLSREEKIAKLSRISYRTYLRDFVKVDEQVLEMFQRWGMSYWCVGMDEVPAIYILGYTDGGGMPGLEHTLSTEGGRGSEPYIFHFPDGNASVARLLVRSLIPEALPGRTMEDSVTARLNYGMLDRDGAALRIRLNSTAVNIAHTRDSKAVDVTYVHAGDAHTVRAKKCVLACYNSAIPYICPELPDKQKAGLAYNVKIPLTYTKVMVPNWRAFADLGTRFVYYTNDFYKQVELDYPVSIGDYAFGADPDQPMALHMCHVPYFDDIQGPEQWRAGRRKMLETPFSIFEHHVRDQLDQALSGAGFDADRDIEGITVNRWAHGYSYSPDLLWEPEYRSDADKPWVVGRQPFGRISIANSDAGAAANTDSAITHGHRAVQQALSS
ncbi:MAG: NAD(P)-binding protein [Gammaproteobacteria bacterium]|nr:NAD(P)-binding protein [Gammaproteobacteria bacterium]MBT8093213.1 NAD(P)-binding protein [Gammaproteobacteria bacterium]MBT8106019.1 NAD(P)-binding protein [Gammaproteobacteria bacterium]NNK26033.1 NAD(P)-binding protein [Woeseiaceae bacterium]